jgi:protein tyrosine phosphatase
MEYFVAKTCQINEELQQKWQKFSNGKKFANWSFNKSQEEIIFEFYELHKWRLNVWFEDLKTLKRREEFNPSEHLLKENLSVFEDIAAFKYNNIDPSYNSSYIIVDDLHFLAVEAPREHLFSNFFNLLHNHDVKCLVRLLMPHESVNYWKNIIEEKNGFHVLKLPDTNTIMPYYFINSWKDNEGVEQKDLLDLVLKVYEKKFPLIACHCFGGVGRTGTFIAAYTIIDALEKLKKQNKIIEISIEKIVAQLALQRFLMVAQASQYVTLYRVVDHYMSMV